MIEKLIHYALVILIAVGADFMLSYFDKTVEAAFEVAADDEEGAVPA